MKLDMVGSIQIVSISPFRNSRNEIFRSLVLIIEEHSDHFIIVDIFLRILIAIDKAFVSSDDILFYPLPTT
jgi:hypothetical protein